MAGSPDPTIADQSGAQQRRSIVETWTEVVADAGGLVRAEAALARAETADNLKAFGKQSAKMAAGFALLMMALIFLTVGAVVALATFTGLLAALLIVTGACLGIGVMLVLSGRNSLSAQQILPERSLNRMSRDLERLSERAVPPMPAVPPAGGRHETS